MDAYYPGNDKMDQEYEKNPAGHVGFKCPELRQVRSCVGGGTDGMFTDAFLHTLVKILHPLIHTNTLLLTLPPPSATLRR